MSSERSEHAPTAGSQTLDRGLRALELLSEATGPMTIAGLADGLGVHRSSAYRVLRTLEEHHLVLRDDAGLIRVGPRLAALGRGAVPSLTQAAFPVLTGLANTLGMTAFIAVLDAGEVITLLSVEPALSHASVAQRPGSRHPATQGSTGHALEASLSPAEHGAAFAGRPVSEEALFVREHGYALSHDEVIPGLTATAVPLRLTGEPPATLAVVHIGVPDDLEFVVAQLREGAARIASFSR